ncbi:MAG: DegT/DnrJ/EryC1/StrS family aminotransferase [Acidimicrobiia bacterium]|nr:DegT/DnrJ/EryC1/StrS family aminotransferase [Acidimicrobiia bacterium]MDH4308773.1 DegT/DnrJ/EryC1/StrS family aminotransferase [Acidimicrobiia bacterium]MDH5293122.1 DegT/DnrJ/EryC1/StrS family aminotransferase [Acidimicrobiia bacterium]
MPDDLPVIPFVDLAAEYQRLKAPIDAAIAGVLDRGDYVLGRAVGDLEVAFAGYSGSSHGIGVDSGFSALELIFRGFGFGPGDEVITQANTFVATAAAIESAGATPVLVDIDPITNNLDPSRLEAAITNRTKAVVPVHLYGRPADMGPINEIARERGLKVIEDACQAHGAFYRGKRAGALGDAAAFSFYPSKNLGAPGDGGMVVTSDAELAGNVRLLRNLGSSVKYRHDIKGFNRRLDTVHAAVLGVKLGHLDEANASRMATADELSKRLSDLPIVTPSVGDEVSSVFHLYVIETDRRDALSAHLGERGVSTGIHYPVPIHLQPAYRSMGHSIGDFPVSEAKAERILSLPMYPHMPAEYIDRIVEGVRSFFEE